MCDPWQSLDQFLKANHEDKDWTIHQNNKRDIYIDVEGDAYIVFNLIVTEAGEVIAMSSDPEGLTKIGMDHTTAQAAMDEAAASAQRS